MVTIKEFTKLYRLHKKKYEQKAYRRISSLFQYIKVKYKNSFKGRNHEQSWRSFKGFGKFIDDLKKIAKDKRIKA